MECSSLEKIKALNFLLSEVCQHKRLGNSRIKYQVNPEVNKAKNSLKRMKKMCTTLATLSSRKEDISKKCQERKRVMKLQIQKKF